MAEKHASSREVTIHRAQSFLQRAQGSDAAIYMEGSKQAIGSYFESPNSAIIATGLTIDEEDILLPLVLDYGPKDSQFRKAVREYYADIDTKIPPAGRTFETGLTDNSKGVTATNRPLNIHDYLAYKHAIGHPQVAGNAEETRGNPQIRFYVFNPHQKADERKKLNDAKDEATAIYADIKKNPVKIDQMLRLLGHDPREFDESATKKEDKDSRRATALRDIMETNPVRFKEVHEQGDIEERAWIETFVTLGIFRKSGEKYFDIEGNSQVSNSYMELLFWMKDEENSARIAILKGVAQEKMAGKYSKKTNINLNK